MSSMIKQAAVLAAIVALSVRPVAAGYEPEDYDDDYNGLSGGAGFNGYLFDDSSYAASSHQPDLQLAATGHVAKLRYLALPVETDHYIESPTVSYGTKVSHQWRDAVQPVYSISHPPVVISEGVSYHTSKSPFGARGGGGHHLSVGLYLGHRHNDFGYQPVHKW